MVQRSRVRVRGLFSPPIGRWFRCASPQVHARAREGSSQALAWMQERKAELLQVPYFHNVFTPRAEIGAIAYQNKALIWPPVQGLLGHHAHHRCRPKHLGAKIGITAVLHTWVRRLPTIPTCT